jgi:hypothetical protein
MRKSLEFNSRADNLYILRIMRRHTSFIPGVLILLLAFTVSAKVIVVNTTNNFSPDPGETNLVMAIKSLADGDAIHFNIPGPGPFYLVTPPLVPDNGYPAITNHNVTIDGYTQPGSSPNSNTILSSNNADIQIVLDSRDGGARVEDIGGYSLEEAATLLVKGGTNVTISGFCFLGPGTGAGTDLDPDRYAVSFALEAHSGHIHGCWFGVDLDRTNVFLFRDAVTGFRGTNMDFINGTVLGVEKNALNASVARSQFNIIVGEFIPIILEGDNHRISGNFLNVFPDGLTDYNANAVGMLESFIEIGRRGNNTVVGTDGDGVNDAEERNIFGGVTFTRSLQLLQWYSSNTRTNIVIAGNYFGVGVDGVTRFANDMKLISDLTATASMRIGSDFDGISDDLEANFISMNYPFEALYPTLDPQKLYVFSNTNHGQISLRGNRLMGANIPPFSFADGTGDRLPGFTNYYTNFFWTTNAIIPALSPTSTQGRLRGYCPLGKGSYTNVIIDLYLADQEGWTNGQLFQFSELAYTNSMGDTQYYGFAQGRAYLGSFVDNGAQDLDPAPGHFDFDVSSINIPVSELVTVTANYSADAPGTHNGRTHTSDFAMPIHLLPAPRMNLTTMENNVLISWPTNSGFLTIQSATSLAPANWTDRSEQPTPVGTNYQVSLPISSGNVFFRLKY